MLMSDRVTLRHCYFEMRIYGKYLRVSAIDPDTGIEAVATGPRSMGQAMIQRNAKHKLEYLLTKKRREEQKNNKDWFA